MHRQEFIVALCGLIAAPWRSFIPGRKIRQGAKEGFKVDAGEGRLHGHLHLKGVNSNILDVKISGEDTQGDLAIFEQSSLSQGRGTPLHIHPAQDEIFYVVEGAYYFQVGDEKYAMTAGDTIFLPRGVPHAWTQRSERGKMIVTVQPAGKLENFFVTMASLDHLPSQKEIADIFADNGMRVVGPPLSLD